MKLKAAKGLLSYLPEAWRARVVEALGGSLLGMGTSDDAQLQGFRPLSQRARTRDLDMLSHDQMVRVALYLYGSNNLARWLVDMPVSLTIGQDLSYTVTVDTQLPGAPADPDALIASIREVLDRYWEHPTHDISGRAEEYGKTFLVTGHLILPVFGVNGVDGVPQLDIIDAQQLEEVEPLPGSAMVPAVVRFRPADLGSGGDVRRLKILSQNFDGLYVPESGDLVEPGTDGSCLYFRYGNLLNSLRGVSYLMDIADWLDAFDQFVWATLDRAKIRNRIVWHVSMAGATKTDIKAKVDELMVELANPGAVFGSNEQLQLEAKAAQIEASDSTELGRMILTHILGSKGIPESWYSHGGDVNRSTAAEQTDVAYKFLQSLQKRFRTIFRTLLYLGYDFAQAKQPSQLPARNKAPWLTLEPELPVISERDVSRYLAGAAQFAAGLGEAVDSELVSQRTARSAFLTTLGKATGTTYSADKEEAQIDAEEEERKKRQAEQQAEFARERMAGELPGAGEDQPDAGEGPGEGQGAAA